MSCCSGRVPDPRQAKAKHRPENQTMKRRLQSRKLRRHEAARPAPRVTELIERETLGYHHDPGWRNNMPIVIVSLHGWQCCVRMCTLPCADTHRMLTAALTV